VVSTFLTIPSLALFALLIPVVGHRRHPRDHRADMYALLPIVRNTVSGLYSVDRPSWSPPRAWGWADDAAVEDRAPQRLAGHARRYPGRDAADRRHRRHRRAGRRTRAWGRRSSPERHPPDPSPGSLDALLGGTLIIVLLAVLFDLFYLAIGRLTIPRGIRE
jgi:osmoprotectant transport system permease protein